MPNKQVPFSQARQQFTALLDEVERSGQPVTILRRGKPAAVVISHDDYVVRFPVKKRKPWRLAGSIKVKPGVDIEKVLKKMKEERIRMFERRQKALAKALRDS